MQRSALSFVACSILTVACNDQAQVIAPPLTTETGGVSPIGTGGVLPIETGGMAPIETGGVAPIETGGVTPIETGGVTPIETGGMAPIETGGVTPIETGGVTPIETGGAVDMEDPALRPCLADGDEVVLIGDSYSNYGLAHRPLVDFLEERARPAGALGALDSYRDYSAAGTTMASGLAAIPGQWRSAKVTVPIHAVVMTGGGNDVLIDNQSCRDEGSEKTALCQQVVENSLNQIKELWTDMKATGVTDVVYFWYPHIPGGLLTGYKSGTSISDYTYPMLESAAASASDDTFHVHTVPTVEIFEGHPEYFASDGLHANDLGEGKIADAIWEKMTDNCIAQAEDSGCCQP